MKRGARSKGFTIVETMIVLAVSGAIMIGALSLVGGSQNRVQFDVALKDVDQQITTVVNNVANGFYPDLKNQVCTVDDLNFRLNLSPAASSLGKNLNCVFLGSVIEFTDQDYFNVYTIAGRRIKSSTNTVNTKMADSYSTALITPNSPQKINLSNGIEVSKIKIDTNGDGAYSAAESSYGSIGFFTTLGDEDSSGQLLSGSLSIDYIGMLTSGIDSTNDIPGGAGYIQNGFRSYYAGNVNPSSGIMVCLKSNTTNDYGIITIGGEGRSATTSVRVEKYCP